MINMFTVFYLIFLLGCGISSIFVIYHINKYSINKHSSTTMLILFISVITILLLINISLFKNIDFTDMLNLSSNFNSTNQSF